MAFSDTVSVTDATAVAAEGFVFGYPLVLMHRTRAWMTAVPEPDQVRMRAPVNTFVHARKAPEAKAGQPRSPRACTLRSCAWLDLGETPVILRVPNTHGRFYALSLVDPWTNVFASVGARTTGTDGGTYIITAPGANAPRFPGALPISAPTRVVRIAGFTQVDGDDAYAEAHAVQDAYELAPLMPAAPAGEALERRASRTPPVAQVERMDARTFFSELADQMRDNPPRLEDRKIVDRMRRLGLLPEGATGWPRLRPEVQRAVAQGTARGRARVASAAKSPPGDAVGDWRIRFRLGRYGTDYLSRAGAACAGLEAGPAADELPAFLQTDQYGGQLDGRHSYVLTFAPGRLPPVHGFWTLTTGDARQALLGYPMGRNSIGDLNGLVLETDGALSIRIQHTDPGGRVPNWLAAPSGAFHLLLRLYWPQHEVLDRQWTPPGVMRVNP
jgi:hypothetical protein